MANFKAAANWNFGDLLDAVARVVPGDRPAIVCGNHIVSWRDFDTRTNRIARAMVAHGLQPGDRVGIFARNIPEFIEAVASAFKARVAWVNINYRYTLAEVAHVLNDSQAKGIFFQSEFAGVVEAVRAALPELRFAVEIGPAGEYETLASHGNGDPLEINRSPDDIHLLYTGGTTGKPKGVVWRSGDARAVQLESPTVKVAPATLVDHLAIVAANPYPGRVLPACPLMHGAGTNSSLAELVSGGTVILLPSDRFDPFELWSEASLYRATRILIVGDVFARPMLAALEAHPARWDLSWLKIISSSGLMWSREVKNRLISILPTLTLIDILAASEASGFGYAVANATRETPTGFFEPTSATVIIDVQTDRVLGDAEPGEGWLARRPPFAAGYHGDPAKTAATFRRIGEAVYAIPGDIAERCADGRLRLVGRDNMVINTGGEKVFAEEVEEAIKRIAGVEDAMVIGVPDRQWGKAIVALIEAQDEVTEAGVRAALLVDLAAYKSPKMFIRLDELPRHASGKGDYRKAIEIAVAAYVEGGAVNTDPLARAKDLNGANE